MKNFELFVGLRYFRSKKGNKFTSFITIISIVCIAIGVMALIIVFSLMNGFQDTIRNKILNTGFHIYLTSYGRESAVYNYQDIMKEIKQKEGDRVEVITPFYKSQALIKSYMQRIMGIDFQGIEPDLFKKDESFLKTVTIVSGKADLNENNNILLGIELAKYLDVKAGDYIDIISPEGGNIRYMGRLAPIMRRFMVSGIFKTGYYEYDLKLAFTSLSSMQELVNKPGAAWGIGIKIKDIFNAPWIAKELKKYFRYNYQVFTWEDLNRNLFTALKTEKTMMAIIVFLVIFIAAINIASTLIMMITEKKKEIAILRSFGASSEQITNIFLLTGFFIGCMGIIFGVGFGLLVSHYLQSILNFIENVVNAFMKIINVMENIFAYVPTPEQFQLLPKDVYYLDRLPVDIWASDIFGICLGTILIILIFSYFPALQATKFKPMEIIRNE